MPGMLDTILNLGLNDAAAEGLALRTTPRFAFDAYRRFVAMHANIALGVSRELLRPPLSPFRARARRGCQHGTRTSTKLECRRAQARFPDAAIPPVRAQGSGHDVQGHRPEGDGRDFRATHASSSWGGHLRGLQVVEQPPRRHLPPDARDSRRLGYRLQRAGDGPATSGTRAPAGVAFTRRPVDRREETLRRVAAGTLKARTSWREFARAVAHPDHRTRGRRFPRGQDAGGVRGEPRSHCGDPRAPLPRNAGLEFTIQSGKLYMLQCRNRKARAQQPLYALRSTWRKRGSSAKTRAESSGSTPVESTSSCTRRLTRRQRKNSWPGGPSASPGERRAATSPSTQIEAERRGRTGQAHHPRARRDIAGGHPRDEGCPRHLDGHRGGMTSHAAVVARGKQRASGRRQRRGGQLRDADDDHHRLRRAPGVRRRTSPHSGRATSSTIDGGSGHIPTTEPGPPCSAALSGEFPGELMAWGRPLANDEGPRQRRHAARREDGAGLRRRGHRLFAGPSTCSSKRSQNSRRCAR